jgi:hypothetical protein
VTENIERLEAENAALREALEHAASYMATLRMDRPVTEDGEVVGHWQTVDWLIGLRGLSEKCHSIALADASPVVVLTLEEAKEIVRSFEDEGVGAPDRLAAKIRRAEEDA